MSNQLNMFNDESKVVENRQPLFTGLAKVKPIILNPTLEEGKELGLPMMKEPEYLGKDSYNKAPDGTEPDRLQYDFYVQLPVKGEDDKPLYTKVTFFVTNLGRTSKDQKPQWTNDLGQFTWSNNKASEEYEWFKEEGERQALYGEEELVNFMRMWGNVENDAAMPVDFEKAFSKGAPVDIADYTSKIIRLGNKVEVLLIVNKGQYQGVYTGTFGRANVNNVNKFKKDLDQLIEYYQTNGKSMKFDFGESLKLKKFEPKVDFGSNEPKPEGSTDIDEEELPF